MLGQSRMETYIQIQQTGQLCQDIVDVTVTFGHSRQDVTLGDSKWNSYIRTQGQLQQDRVDGRVTIGYSRQENQLHYDTVVLIIMFGHTRQYDTVDQLHQTQLTLQLNQDMVDGTITLQHSRQNVSLGHSKWDIYVRTQGQLH